MSNLFARTVSTLSRTAEAIPCNLQHEDYSVSYFRHNPEGGRKAETINTVESIILYLHVYVHTRHSVLLLYILFEWPMHL